MTRGQRISAVSLSLSTTMTFSAADTLLTQAVVMLTENDHQRVNKSATDTVLKMDTTGFTVFTLTSNK